MNCGNKNLQNNWELEVPRFTFNFINEIIIMYTVPKVSKLFKHVGLIEIITYMTSIKQDKSLGMFSFLENFAGRCKQNYEKYIFLKYVRFLKP